MGARTRSSACTTLGGTSWTEQFGGDQEPEAATGVAFEGPGGDVFVSGGIGGTFPGETREGFIDVFVMKVLVDDPS